MSTSLYAFAKQHHNDPIRAMSGWDIPDHRIVGEFIDAQDKLDLGAVIAEFRGAGWPLGRTTDALLSNGFSASRVRQECIAAGYEAETVAVVVADCGPGHLAIH